jgi:hypothetical protein
VLSLACFLAMSTTGFVAAANAHLRTGATLNDNSVKAGSGLECHYDIVSHAERCDNRVCDGTCRSVDLASARSLVNAACIDCQHHQSNCAVAVQVNWPAVMHKPNAVRGCPVRDVYVRVSSASKSFVCSLLMRMPVTCVAPQKSILLARRSLRMTLLASFVVHVGLPGSCHVCGQGAAETLHAS